MEVSRTMKYITEKNYPTFRQQYVRAEDVGNKTFEFEGQLVMTSFGKYMCEHVEGKRVPILTEQERVKQSGRW